MINIARDTNILIFYAHPEVLSQISAPDLLVISLMILFVPDYLANTLTIAHEILQTYSCGYLYLHKVDNQICLLRRFLFTPIFQRESSLDWNGNC